MAVIWRFHPDGEFIGNLKVKAHRDPSFLAWIRKQKCYSCPTRGHDMINPITASHIFRGYHGLKNHDWACVPMCGYCHWEFEYHKDVFAQRAATPTREDGNMYYLKYLKETGKPDLRTPEQMNPV